MTDCCPFCVSKFSIYINFPRTIIIDAMNIYRYFSLSWSVIFQVTTILTTTCISRSISPHGFGRSKIFIIFMSHITKLLNISIICYNLVRITCSLEILSFAI